MLGIRFVMFESIENMIVGLEDTIVGLENMIVGLEDTIDARLPRGNRASGP